MNQLPGSERQLERALVVAGMVRDNDSSESEIAFRQGQDAHGSSKPGNKHMRLRVISLWFTINRKTKENSYFVKKTETNSFRSFNKFSNQFNLAEEINDASVWFHRNDLL